jgi:hypothetical protein
MPFRIMRTILMNSSLRCVQGAISVVIVALLVDSFYDKFGNLRKVGLKRDSTIRSPKTICRVYLEYHFILELTISERGRARINLVLSPIFGDSHRRCTSPWKLRLLDTPLHIQPFRPVHLGECSVSCLLSPREECNI